MSKEQARAPTGPTDVFDVLGNETRLRIIQELAVHRRENWQRSGCQFSELRRRVGVRDPGTFNYHLDELRDQFVVKEDDTYVLTCSGIEVADAILSGTFDPTEFDTSGVKETESPCPECSETLRIRYENTRCAIECPTAGELFVTSIPPAGVSGRDGEQLLRLVCRDLVQEMTDAHEGVCFHCYGRMEARAQTEQPLRNPVTDAAIDAPGYDATAHAVTVVYGCHRCETVFTAPPELSILGHPAVVSAFFDDGIDIRHTAIFSSAVRSAISGPDLRSEDPLRLRMVIDPGETRTELVLDRTMDVCEVATD